MIKHDGSQENEATNKLFLSILNRFLNNIEFKVLCKKYSVLRSSNVKVGIIALKNYVYQISKCLKPY